MFSLRRVCQFLHLLAGVHQNGKGMLGIAAMRMARLAPVKSTCALLGGVGGAGGVCLFGSLQSARLFCGV